MNRTLFSLLVSCICASGTLTYRVTENAAACSEVRIPKWTRQAGGGVDLWPISTWGCEYDVRSQGKTIYIGLSCGSVTYWRMMEKYGVDLSHTEEIRKIDEATWDAGTVLEPEKFAQPEQAIFQPNALKYQSHLYPKSGLNWDQYGKALISPGKSRMAVYSYDGVVKRSYEFSFKPQRFDGTYWTEIYDVASTNRLIQIRGEFHGVDLTEFQGKSYWLGGRFFLQPLEVRGMRRLLICDVDAAAKASGVTESDAPVPLDRAKPFLQHSRSDYQMRFLEPETPQAHITAFHDEPVFYPGTGDIERVNVTALLDVQVPGQYSLFLDLAGIQERAEAELSVGSAQLTVPIPVARLRELGSGGPYKIHWARLTRQAGDGEIVADNRFYLASGVLRGPYAELIDASTQAYTLRSLGSSLYFTGEDSATLIRGLGSEPGRLEIRIGIYSQDTGCRGSGLLARALLGTGAAVTDTPGQRTLVLNFTGKGVSEPGPYVIEQVSVICGRNFIRRGRIDVSAN
jgi:hypothetical protein